MLSELRESEAEISGRPSVLLKDEREMIEAYRRAKRLGYADIAVTIQNGMRVKLWLTEKVR